MKIVLYGIVLIFLVLIRDEDNLGKYSYKNGFYSESIDLKADHKFVYFSKQEFLSYEVKGNYRLSGDSIVLDSYPQRDKIIVLESNKGSQKNNVFFINNKMGEPLNYSLFLILDDGKQVSLIDQWEKSKIKNQKIKGFYIIDSKGLKSPTYIKKGKFSNYFKIQFETNRVFENETWYINDSKIKPKGLNGEFQDYFLER